LRLHVSVHDTGIGFDASQADALFSPFVQADSSITRHFGGTGLGLAITRRLVQHMGGYIRADSAPGQGAVFSFSVVCALVSDVTNTGHSPATQAAAPVGAAHRLHILLAEDNPVNQMVAKLMLENLGHRVSLVADGQQCLQALAQNRFDLLLLDVMMPNMDGIAALTQIRRQEASNGEHLPVMMVTAHAMLGDEERFRSLGADGYLSKPINLASLEKAIALQSTGRNTKSV
jgi:CheY-like chemotaxis protein